eukprot:Opistho-2@24529
MAAENGRSTAGGPSVEPWRSKSAALRASIANSAPAHTASSTTKRVQPSADRGNGRPLPVGSGTCFRFERSGSCKFGSECHFVHTITKAGPRNHRAVNSDRNAEDALSGRFRDVLRMEHDSSTQHGAFNTGSAYAPSHSSTICSKPVTKLYVDALNYSEFFMETEWSINRAKIAIQSFVAGARNAGISLLKVFIDVAMDTSETEEKWRNRREKEVVSGKKRMMHGMSTIMGDLFRREGVDVCYSLDADNDDTLAAHAHADGADILSRDKDYFRYTGATYRVFSDFDRSSLYSSKRLELIAHPQQFAQRSSPRDLLLSPLPAYQAIPVATKGTDALQMDATFVPVLIKRRLYRRGAPSPLVRALELNPHERVRPLRRALYALLFPVVPPCAKPATEYTPDNAAPSTCTSNANGGGVRDDKEASSVSNICEDVVIREIIPLWDSVTNRVKWLCDDVTPLRVRDTRASDAQEQRDGAVDECAQKWTAVLAGSPRAAFETLFPAESNASASAAPRSVSAKDWKKHCMACRSVVYELFAAATRQELLGLLLGP